MMILFAGMLAGDPGQGGATWAVLQYLLGLRQLGHEVLFVEPVKQLTPASAEYFHRVASMYAIDGAMLQTGTHNTVGLSYADLQRPADLLINISGMLTDEALLSHIPVRAYLDLDPAFVQCWHDQGIDMRFDEHTHFVTVGLNVGKPACKVPTAGLNWIKTLQPIVLEHWPYCEPVPGSYSTIANWRGYGSVEYQGVHYGQKAHSLRQLIELPRLCPRPLELALAIHPDETKDLELLRNNAWRLVDPSVVANSPAQYQQYIQNSRGEFGLAKSGYVESWCGWFSDRSVCYLASGRPVIAQDTGFAEHLPVGEGLFAFRDVDSFVDAIAMIEADYPRHSRAARLLAEQYFESNLVLPRLLHELFA